MSDDPTTDTSAPAPDAAPAEQPPSAAASAEPEPATLGDGGKKALDAERRARRQAEKAAADALAKVKEFDRTKSEAQRLADQLAEAQQQAATARAEALRLRVASETGLAPDLHEFLVGDDEEQLRAKAAKLMAATAAGSEPRRPAPDPTQGAKPAAAGTEQLTRADLARMTPEQIVTAQESGRLADLLGSR